MKHLSLSALLLAFAPPALAHPVTVKSCDREVTFDAIPARAASNDVNLTEMMLVLGLTDRMVGYTGISGWNKLDETMRAGVAELPELSERYPSREVLIGADLDFWFAGWNYGMKVGGEVTPETLAPFGIAVYELTESCIHIMARDRIAVDDMFTDIRNLATIFGVPERAEALITGWQADLAEIAATIPQGDPLRVFVYDSGEDTPFTAGRYAMPTSHRDRELWRCYRRPEDRVHAREPGLREYRGRGEQPLRGAGVCRGDTGAAQHRRDPVTRRRFPRRVTHAQRART